MQTNKLLLSFNYAVMPSMSSVSLAKTEIHSIARHSPLLQVKIDFKNGEFNLVGDWHFMMASNKNANPYWLSYHTGRVEIDADIYPVVIDLDDNNSDGLLFPVEGIIKDRCSLNSCSGLIELDKTRTGNGITSHEWNISINLYDYQVDNCEIKFKLPVYLTSGNEKNN